MVFLPLIKTSQFLPTPSARRATCDVSHILAKIPISTHALREEGDSPASP